MHSSHLEGDARTKIERARPDHGKTGRSVACDQIDPRARCGDRRRGGWPVGGRERSDPPSTPRAGTEPNPEPRPWDSAEPAADLAERQPVARPRGARLGGSVAGDRTRVRGGDHARFRRGGGSRCRHRRCARYGWGRNWRRRSGRLGGSRHRHRARGRRRRREGRRRKGTLGAGRGARSGCRPCRDGRRSRRRPCRDAAGSGRACSQGVGVDQEGHDQRGRLGDVAAGRPVERATTAQVSLARHELGVPPRLRTAHRDADRERHVRARATTVSQEPDDGGPDLGNRRTARRRCPLQRPGRRLRGL